MKRSVKHLFILMAAVMLIAALPLCTPAQAEPMAALAPAARSVKASNWVLNGDFETGNLDNWSAWQGTAVSEDAAAGGNYGVHLTGNGSWGGMLRQDVTVQKGTTYVITFWAKVNAVGANLLFFGASTDTRYAPAQGSNDLWISNTSWKKLTYTVTPTDDTKMAINFSGGGTNTAESVYIDEITMYPEGTEPDQPDLPPAEPLTLLSFGVVNNRPMTESKNRIDNGSFETAASAQWAVDTFLSDRVSVVRDSTTPDGQQALFFNTSGTTEPEWHVFWVEVEKNTNYTFSAWLKGSFLSADSVGRATIGVIDPNNKKFLTMPEKNRDVAGGMFSTNMRQLVPTAWDGRWHLRSVTFNTEEKTTVGIALYGYGTELWVDGLALFEVGDGKKYTSDTMNAMISPTAEEHKIVCAPADSLIQNATMEDTASTFWQTGNGWQNGFMGFADNQYEYGRSLMYTGSENAYGLHYIRWIDVKPHTRYTFSADVKILQDGAGMLTLVDGKLRSCTNFMEISFSSEDFGADWFSLCFTFDTDAFDVIGIGVCDLGGRALIDNVRLFEAEDGAPGEDTFVARADGWYQENGQWAYYENGRKVKAAWKKDSVGWCYLDADGYMAIKQWIMDSVGWCYVGGDGYCVTNKWVADSVGWCYLDGSGRMATNKWIKDSVGWCYVGNDGYCVTNKWVADSVGWCYLDGSGRMVTNKWIMDSVGWCYVGGDGYCVTNKWVADSKGWCYLDGNGRMATNQWIADSKGWCYVDGSGYCVTNQWVKDSKGWCYLDGDGRMVYSRWVDHGGKRYYINASGYMVTGKQTIGGKQYTFDASGACISG